MKAVLLFSLLTGATAFAQQNLPNYTDIRMAGRVPAFASPRGVTWFLPIAFQTQMSCSPQAQTRSCIVKIFNTLTPQENEMLMKTENAVRSGVIAISAVNPSVVKSIAESFETNIKGLNVSEMKLQTLAMNDRAPYASIAIRGDAASIAQVERDFGSGRLGTFNSEVTMNVENVGDYLAIRNGESLQQMLMALPQNLDRQQMIDSIQAIVAKLDLQRYGVSMPEASMAAAAFIRSTYFQYTRYRGYAAVLPSQLPKTVVIRDEHSQPYRVHCVSWISLQANANVETGCVEVPQ